MKKLIKWFIYTVLIGLTPFFIRLFIYYISADASKSFLFNETDFIILALVLNITNINELEDKYEILDWWKTLSIGFSALFLVLMAGILSVIIYSELNENPGLDRERIKMLSGSLALVSLIFGGAIMYKLKTGTHD